MRFGLTQDQTAIANSVADTLRRALPQSDLVKRFDAHDLDAPLWREFAQLGTGQILVPAAQGGLGLDLLTLAQVAEQMGRSGASLPAINNALAAWVLALAGTSAQKEKWLGAVADGAVCAAFSLPPAGGEESLELWRFEGSTLSGRGALVEWGIQAQLLIVGADSGQLMLVDMAHPGVKRSSVSTVDGTRPLAEVALEGVPAEHLQCGEGFIDRLRDAMLVLLAADAYGAASSALNMAVEYAKVRTQFDRLIGSFQGIKHQLANLTAELEPCRPMVWYAAHAWDAIPDQRARAAAMAKAHVTDVAVRTARMAVEVHGGIGYTWECTLHVFLKRAMHDRASMGVPERHRERAATLAGW